MSTRATYKLTEEGLPPVEVYIHHDGYPKGAAMYYTKALNELKENGRGFIASFIRANEGANVTVANQHGDTEYHYEMSVDGIKEFTHEWDANEFKHVRDYEPKEFIALQTWEKLK